MRTIWARWLGHRRHGGDRAAQAAIAALLKEFRDRVLGHAGLSASDHLLDVGCGDGLIAFGALERLRQGHVTFSDISEDLLSQCVLTAGELSVLDHCSFIQSSADSLQEVGDASVDVVTTRSVLIYVSKKQRAFDEFYRVLKPGGRFSCFEPINRFPVELPQRFRRRLLGYDASAIPGIAKKVSDGFDKSSRSISTMVDFDERDLVAMACRAGFEETHLDLRIDVEPGKPRSWEAFARSAGNPLQPSLEEVMKELLTPGERRRLERVIRPQVERGGYQIKGAGAYLWARKV